MMVFLWLAFLLTLILWLILRRWRQQAESGVFDTAVAPSPLLPLTPQLHKQMIAVMLSGGLLLFVLGQLTFFQVPSPGKWAVAGLMALGAGLFLWGGSRIRQDELGTDWLAGRLHRLGHWLGIAGWQALLLCLALAFTLLARFAAGDIALARRWDVSVVAWLLALGFVLLGGVSLAEWRFWLRDSRFVSKGNSSYDSKS